MTLDIESNLIKTYSLNPVPSEKEGMSLSGRGKQLFREEEVTQRRREPTLVSPHDRPSLGAQTGHWSTERDAVVVCPDW